MVGTLEVGEQIRQTHIRLGNKTDNERYVTSIDEVYNAEHSICNGYNYQINTPQFNLVNRSQNGNGCDFKHEIIEYRGKNCFIPTKGSCFINVLTS